MKSQLTHSEYLAFRDQIKIVRRAWLAFGKANERACAILDVEDPNDFTVHPARDAINEASEHGDPHRILKQFNVRVQPPRPNRGATTNDR